MQIELFLKNSLIGKQIEQLKSTSRNTHLQFNRTDIQMGKYEMGLDGSQFSAAIPEQKNDQKKIEAFLE